MPHSEGVGRAQDTDARSRDDGDLLLGHDELLPLAEAAVILITTAYRSAHKNRPALCLLVGPCWSYARQLVLP